ncbi:FKBP-type peptidyl-prolyl cis-trans isomerase [Geobacter sp. AOG1]|uniref:FKBP-type peptidyl-prolyl cis-trans isomerase n=1 Tax=Geobacter sp. AOG1 TaxID=1566346 RepID=UPI001CC6AC92|nr:FKBP-type peptidyl-prolyl cis-trans isomerase [Geobacter sp. AOG1]GFE58601.1 peptidyl-prolyl cis-trans isomerase [Geobacter sp. AOG1]
MHRLIVTVLIALLSSPAFAGEPPKMDVEKTLYAVGLTVARQLAVFNLTPAELEVVKRGVTDGVTGTKPEVELSAYSEKVQELARTRIKAQAEKMAPLNKEFLEKAAKEKGAVKTDSGLIYLSLAEGSGTSPGPTDTVKVNYRGMLPDGKEFDSSYKRGTPTEFRLDGVIACWKEGLQKMKPGGKAKLVCPATLAYGETGVGSVIPPGSPLAFDVELLEVKK